MSETADRVKKIVVEHLGVEADKVTETRASSTTWVPTASTSSSSSWRSRKSSGSRSPTMPPRRSRPSKDAITYIDEHKA